jgi:hypothetical protein
MRLAQALASEPYFSVMPPVDAADSWLDDGFMSTSLGCRGDADENAQVHECTPGIRES